MDTNQTTTVEPVPPATSVAEYSATAAALATLREKHGKTVFEVATTKGMTAAKEARAEIKGYRVALEKMRVEIKAPALERCRLIDAEAKNITEQLLALETPIDEVIKAEEKRKEEARKIREDAERERLAQIERERLAAERAEVERLQKEQEAALQAAYDKLAAERAEFDRRQAAAADAEKARRQEADQALARERAVEEARMAEERAAQAARLAEEDRQAQVERDRLAAERAEAHEVRVMEERKAAAERERLAQIERDRIAVERAELQKQQAEEAKRKYDKMLEDLRQSSTDLLAAAKEAHDFLLNVDEEAYALHHVTLALGFAIEHNEAQQQLPLVQPTAKKRTRKGAAA